MRQMLWTCIAVFVAACDIPPDVKSQMSCSTICTCLTPPTQRDECITECVSEGDFATITEDCFECIQQHSTMCSTLENDCEPLCERPQPPPGPDGGSQPPVLVDGGT